MQGGELNPLKFDKKDKPFYRFDPYVQKSIGTIKNPFIYCVCNPSSGNGAACKNLEKFKTLLTQLKLEFSVYLTKSATDLIQHIREIPKKTLQSGILALFGGDGTYSLALDAIYELQIKHTMKIITLLVPGGTGNDLVRSLGYFDFKIYTKNLLEPKIQQIDILQIKYKNLNDEICSLYGLQCGVGLSAETSARSDKFKKCGHLKYKVASFFEICKKARYKINIAIDDREIVQDLDVMLFQASISSHFGGGIPICPRAKIDDGLMDIAWVTSEFNWLGKIMLLDKAFRSAGHVLDKRVSYYQGKKIKVSFKHPTIFQRDGDVFRAKDWIEISVLPNFVHYANILS